MTTQSTTTKEALEHCPLCGMTLPNHSDYGPGDRCPNWTAPEQGDFVAFGHDYAGHYKTFEEAKAVVERRGSGDVYSRVPAPIAPGVDDNDINAGVWFQSAVSGGWYKTRESAGDLSAVRIDGIRFVPSPNALCVCGHIRKVHESFEDHDECMGCIKERDGLTEDHCSWFQAAPASTVAPQQSGDGDTINRSDAIRILQDARFSGSYDLRGLIAEMKGLPNVSK